MAVVLTPESLDLQLHPEGGWFRETWRTTEVVATPHGERPLATCIHFLLQPGERSTWHRVRSAEMWLWQGGGDLVLDLGGYGDQPARAHSVVLTTGSQHLVEPSAWQRAAPAADQAVLVACVVSPGFDMADFEIYG